MATVTSVTMTDDIDGSTDDVVTCAFGLGESQFEIDLNGIHREELENCLAKFIEYARPIGKAPTPRRRRQSSPRRSNREPSQAMRQWAQEAGFTVSERGRISKEVRDAYEAAH